MGRWVGDRCLSGRWVGGWVLCLSASSSSSSSSSSIIFLILIRGGGKKRAAPKKPKKHQPKQNMLIIMREKHATHRANLEVAFELGFAPAQARAQVLLAPPRLVPDRRGGEEEGLIWLSLGGWVGGWMDGWIGCPSSS